MYIPIDGELFSLTYLSQPSFSIPKIWLIKTDGNIIGIVR